MTHNFEDGAPRLFSWDYLAKSLEDTQALAQDLAGLLRPGDMICLEGGMGAGKTTFTKALAQALGVQDLVTSPTFTLVRTYQGRLPLYHFDLFRLEDPDELDFLGFDDYFYGSGVCVVEWPKDFYPVLPAHPLKIQIQEEGPGQRRFTLSQEGEDRIIERLRNENIGD